VVSLLLDDDAVFKSSFPRIQVAQVLITPLSAGNASSTPSVQTLLFLGFSVTFWGIFGEFLAKVMSFQVLHFRKVRGIAHAILLEYFPNERAFLQGTLYSLQLGFSRDFSMYRITIHETPKIGSKQTSSYFVRLWGIS
jgi:hypothetical protein